MRHEIDVIGRIFERREQTRGGHLGMDLRLVPVLHTDDLAVRLGAVERERRPASCLRDELTLDGNACECVVGNGWGSDQRAAITIAKARTCTAQRVVTKVRVKSGTRTKRPPAQFDRSTRLNCIAIPPRIGTGVRA